jgi:membrane protease YdiL (CAAX protease family)
MRFKRAVGIVIALVGQLLIRPLTRGLEADDVCGHVVKWIPAAFLVAYAKLVEDDGVESFGVRWDGVGPFLKRVGTGLAVMMGANVVLAPLHERIGTEDLMAGMAEYRDTSLLTRLFVALTAGVTEEILYRGYALERLEDETDSRLVAAAGSVLAFVVAHKSDQWGWGSLALIAQPATIVTLLYVRSRDLLAVIAVHALNDAIGLLTLERTLDEES